MSFVRVLIQECRPGTIEMLTELAAKTFVPRLRGIPGFVSYQVVKLSDRALAAVATYATRSGAEQHDVLGAEWREEYGAEAIVSVRRWLGEVILDAGPAEIEAHPIP